MPAPSLPRAVVDEVSKSTPREHLAQHGARPRDATVRGAPGLDVDLPTRLLRAAGVVRGRQHGGAVREHLEPVRVAVAAHVVVELHRGREGRARVVRGRHPHVGAGGVRDVDVHAVGAHADPRFVGPWDPDTSIGAVQVAPWFVDLLDRSRAADRLVAGEHPQIDFVERMATALPARAVFMYSHATAQVQRSIWPHRETIVVHPGIDLPEQVSSEELARLRGELGVPDKPVIGIVGRLCSWKGQHHVVRAIALLHERGHQVHGLIVGGDAYDFRARLRAAPSRTHHGARARRARDVHRPGSGRHRSHATHGRDRERVRP